MKQGTLVNRIIVGVLFAALVVYLAVQGWQGFFSERVTTVLSYS